MGRVAEARSRPEKSADSVRPSWEWTCTVSIASTRTGVAISKVSKPLSRPGRMRVGMTA